MNFINKLERKFGRYAIHNLMFYMIIIYALGYVLYRINPSFCLYYLALDVQMVLKGQIWRLFTFILFPSTTNILFLFIELYLYYMIGTALENAWGAFRFNLFYFSGILFNILAAFLLYLFAGSGFYLVGLDFINQSMFFAFAALYPNMQMLLMYIIPIKVKYLAYIYGVMIAFNVFECFSTGNLAEGIAIVIALANFLIFFLMTRNYRRISPREYKRKAHFKKQVKMSRSITRHKCAVCGRTELDDDSLEFRFCSKCDGNYEYCMEHLFTHEHVHH